MRSLLIPAAAAAILATSSLSFAATHTASGTIKTYDSKAMSLTLADGSVYMLKKGFKDPGLKAGEKVSIAWEQAGSNKTADSVKLVK